MKGFLFVAALAVGLFSAKALYARWKAKRDPVDPEAIRQTRMTGGGGGAP